MATTYPDNFPEDAKSEAERKVFEALRNGLGQQYSVISQVAWLARGEPRPEDGETDLLVIHPRWGVLAIEVKGGVISSDPSRGWASNGLPIKDPFRQARAAAHELSRRLRSAVATRSYKYPFGYAVWFPDVDAVRLPPRLDAPDEILLDAADVESVESAIERLFDYWLPEGIIDGPGTTGISELIQLLAPTWTLRPLLGPTIRRESVEQVRLTEQQFSVLRGLRNRRRALIAGYAGSGKTMLAIEKARRAAEDGSRVLFTCYNRNLANAVRAQLDGSGVEVAHFHDLCYRLGREVGADLPDQQVVGMPESYFDVQLPAALELAASLLGPLYDAIIVDEGQDFQDVWWVPLTDLLRDPPRALLYVFFDDRQDIYRRVRAWPIDDEPFELTLNCRSTQTIHRHLQATMPGLLDEVECIGPPGRRVEQITVLSEVAETEMLRKLLHRLLNEQGVEIGDIVILTPRSRLRSQWSEGRKLGNVVLTWSMEPAARGVLVSTIHSFKGLERPIVILGELGHLYQGHEQELLYVGRSRAANHLIELWTGGVYFTSS